MAIKKHIFQIEIETIEVPVGAVTIPNYYTEKISNKIISLIEGNPISYTIRVIEE